MIGERARDSEHTLGREVEVEIDDRLGASLRALAEGFEQSYERGLQLARRVAVEPVSLEARHQDLRVIARHDDVGLERPEAAFNDLAAERSHVIVRGKLGSSGHVPGAGAGRTAVRPVHLDIIPRRAAEQLVDGNAERLRLQIEQGVLDPADRLLDNRARTLSRRAKEIPDDALDRARLAPDDERLQILDDAREAAR